MPWPRSSVKDEMRYLRKNTAGSYEVRLWVSELGYQVNFGTYADLDEAIRVRNREEVRLGIHDPHPRLRSVKPRKYSNIPKELYQSGI